MKRSDKKTDPKFLRSLERGVLRSAFVSLFWAVIQERKKNGVFTLQSLAKSLSANKAEVSRWFRGDPNWTVNTIASLADALDVDLDIKARDRTTGAIYTPAGMQVTASKTIRLSTAAPAGNIWLSTAASTGTITTSSAAINSTGIVNAASKGIAGRLTSSTGAPIETAGSLVPEAA